MKRKAVEMKERTSSRRREWEGVEEDLQAEGREEGKDGKEDREEQGSWEEKVANSIEQ